VKYKPILKVFLASGLFVLAIAVIAGYFVVGLSEAIVNGDKEGFFAGSARKLGEITGLTDSDRYIILLQNSNEIRATGGFMGSYAQVDFKNGVIEAWELQDIYVPDGQLAGHVEPIGPIEEAFGTGEWRLRDANWDPDFRDAAADIKWFFEKGGVDGVDGIIAVNLGFFEPFIDRGFAQSAQEEIESNFFPGSHLKRNLLFAQAKKFLENTSKIKMLARAVNQLEAGEVLVWFEDEALQRKAEVFGWAGALGGYKVDYVYPVESNLGSNKVNCCVSREMEHNAQVKWDMATSDLRFSWKNEHEEDVYRNYMRVVLPGEAEAVSVKVDGVASEFDERKIREFREIGFWAIVPPDAEAYSEIEYRLPLEGRSYDVVYKKQPGYAD